MSAGAKQHTPEPYLPVRIERSEGVVTAAGYLLTGQHHEVVGVLTTTAGSAEWIAASLNACASIPTAHLAHLPPGALGAAVALAEADVAMTAWLEASAARDWEPTAEELDRYRALVHARRDRIAAYRAVAATGGATRGEGT